MWQMQNVLWDALGESSKQLAVNSPLFHLLWRMFGPWECKPKREATYSIKRKWIFFFPPNVSFRLKATGDSCLICIRLLPTWVTF